MRFYDTAQKQYVDFTPGPIVQIYTCGITPYDSAHLGHIFTFMTYDLLQRRLEDRGHKVRLVRNITDVDEPIFQKAAELGIPYQQLAEQETAAFQTALQQLNFRPAFSEPRASQYVVDMADAVQVLLESGRAYRLDDDVYFDVTQQLAFGKFSGYNHRLQLAFARNRGGDPERPGKRSPFDFILWRGVSDPSDPAAWETTVGRGRPGWHIECTVMATALLGVPFDIHGGGDDLIFPHHECEIAQSVALGHGQPARHWLHVAPLLFAGEKMSKSLGNLVFAKDLLGSYEPSAVRLALLHYHYRTGGVWLPELLDRSTALLTHLRQVNKHISVDRATQLLGTLQSALDDDLDTHRVIHALQDCVQKPVDRASPPDAPAQKILAQALALIGLNI